MSVCLAQSGARRRMRVRARRAMAGRTVAAVLSVALIIAGLLVPVGPAAGATNPISSLQHQIVALEGQVVASASRIHQLTMQYDQASLKADDLAELVNSDRAAVGRLTAELASNASRLREALILGYVGEYTLSPGVASVTGSVSDPAIREAYISVASGTLQDAIDAYRSSRAELASSETTLASTEKADRNAAASVAAARRSALDAAGSAETQLGRLQAQLTALQQQAAAAQAAARGQAAARAQVAAQAEAAAQAATQGMPVAGGLVSVVRTEVAAVPAPAVSTAAAPAPAAPPPTTTAPPVTPPPAAPPATPTNTVTPAPTTAPAAGGGGAGGVWLELRQCESGDNYQENTGNGYYGAYQFSQQTWTSLGYPGRPDLEPPAMQDQAAMKLQAESGWGQWPACAAALGLT